MGLFNNIINKTLSLTSKSMNIENTMLNDCIAKLREWNYIKTEDTVVLLSSMYCPVCCIYN